MSANRSLSGEALRIEQLAKYAIMDTFPERDFDDLTRIAAQFCNAPIALISLIDERRQWFKSRVGVSERETSREVSFCNHAILGDELFVVPDAELDARFAKNTIFPSAEKIRFYAGAPLISPEGVAIGTLCIMDYQPRAMSTEQQDVLRVLGRQVMAQLNLRRRASELATRERLLFSILDSESECILLLNADADIRMINRAGVAMLQVTALNDAPGRNLVECVTHEDRVAVRDAIARTFEGGRSNISFRLAGEQDDARWLNMQTTPMRNENGDIVELLGVAHDVTERRYTNEERDRLMLMIERTPELVATADLDGHVTYMNSGGRRMLGLSATDDLNALTIADYVPPNWIDFFHNTVLPTALKRGFWEGEMQLSHLRTGERIDVTRTLYVVSDSQGHPKFLGSISRDITARKRAEARWIESEARYRKLFDYAPDGILIVGSGTEYIDANNSICQMLGYSKDELIGMNVADTLVSSEHTHIAGALESIRGHSEHHREWRFKRKDGTLVDADVIATVMPDENVLAVIRDVTDHKRMVDRFRRLVDSNAQGVMFWNADGHISDANDAFLEITGYNREDFEAGRINWLDMTPPEYASLDVSALEQLVAKGICVPFEKEYIRKDGSRVPILIGAARFDDNPSEGVCFVLDLTERKKLEQQFLRAQRMESIGTLAGGIAHDLNNVLGPIVMGVDLLRLSVLDADSIELLDIMSSTAQRGADMVRQVLSFARGVEGRRMEVQLRHLARDIEKIMQETFPKNIRVRVSIDPNLWTLAGEPTQLHQVLMNLCLNARDAMPKGGSISISAENYPLDAQYAAMNAEALAGPYVLLQVEDTGLGITADILEKIFDPFFTTKDVGKGTGLGLSTSVAIVKSHGGFIRVYSEPGKGTKFEVFLPAQTEPLARAEPVESTPLPRGHGELILVVDDELSIRQITQQTLQAFGYKVLLAVDGADAIAVFAEHRNVIAAIITDMMMPVLDGPGTIQVIRRLHPTVPIVAVSGLSTNGQASHIAALGVKYFLPKPHTAEALLNVLQEVLHKKTPLSTTAV